MAACGFGVSGVQVKCLVCGSPRSKLTALPKTVRFDGFAMSRRSNKPLIFCRSSVSEAKVVAANAKVEEDNSKDVNSSDAVTTLVSNAVEVESLLMGLCDTTSIAEVELKLGGFRLYVLRKLADQSAPPQLPVPAPVSAQPVVEAPNSNGSVASTSLALSKPITSSGGIQALLDKAAEEGLAMLRSPRVGYFRRSRTIKGKQAPPSCKQKDVVKEGQVLCYIEQLGGQIPIESDLSGEVVKILREDGEPVGYGDELIAVLPSFPGIKNIQ